MKTLILVRHAKSSWEDFSQPDIERPLNERGKRDAPHMAKRLMAHFPVVDVFVSSPAKRARKTASIFMKEMGCSDNKPQIMPSLYEGSLKDYYDVISDLEDHASTAALFAHNPTLTDLANSLKCREIDNIPTCGVYVVSAPCAHWKEFSKSPKEFLYFDYPRLGT